MVRGVVVGGGSRAGTSGGGGGDAVGSGPERIDGVNRRYPWNQSGDIRKGAPAPDSDLYAGKAIP
jgi:hypothetical protein